MFQFQSILASFPIGDDSAEHDGLKHALQDQGGNYTTWEPWTTMFYNTTTPTTRQPWTTWEPWPPSAASTTRPMVFGVATVIVIMQLL